jgi:hypothetical protein
MERCIGDPSLSEAELRTAAKNWVAKTQLLPGLIPDVNPAKGILCEFLRESHTSHVVVHAICSCQVASRRMAGPLECFER